MGVVGGNKRTVEILVTTWGVTKHHTESNTRDSSDDAVWTTNHRKLLCYVYVQCHTSGYWLISKHLWDQTSGVELDMLGLATKTHSRYRSWSKALSVYWTKHTVLGLENTHQKNKGIKDNVEVLVSAVCTGEIWGWWGGGSRDLLTRQVN